MLALTHAQLAIVTAAADRLPAEKRGLFLEGVAARLQLYGFRFSDSGLASTGLIRRPAA